MTDLSCVFFIKNVKNIILWNGLLCKPLFSDIAKTFFFFLQVIEKASLIIMSLLYLDLFWQNIELNTATKQKPGD